MKIPINNRKNLGKTLNELGLTGYGAEIGVAYGENAKNIMDEWHGKGIFLIDPYKPWEKSEYVDGSRDIPWQGAWDYAHNHLKDHLDRISWLRMTSDAAYTFLSGLEPLDWVYVDGNHHLPQVRKDIEQYWRLVKPGGVMGGHDYYTKNESYYKCDVEQEVNAFVKRNGLELTTTMEDPLDQSWWIWKPTDLVNTWTE